MGRSPIVAAAIACAVFPAPAFAGAWPITPGKTQVIVKAEQVKADEAFDAAGAPTPIFERRDDTLQLFLEHGLTQRLTLQAKVSYVRGEDAAGFDYSGGGPIELGVRTRLFGGESGAVSVYLGGVLAGDGRNAGFAPPGVGEYDLEIRLLAGRSARVFGQPAFAELQLAALERDGLPDERRYDVTFGVQPSDGWQILSQLYGGRSSGGARWLNGEFSAVRDLGSKWRLQAGWRYAINGRQSPIEEGPSIGLWRSF